MQRLERNIEELKSQAPPATSPTNPADDTNLGLGLHEAFTPELKEKMMRLELENKQLKVLSAAFNGASPLQ
jgi:hypothetical protein